jgi:replication factor-a protein 1 (Rpa1)
MIQSLSNNCIKEIYLGPNELNLKQYVVQVIKIKDFGKEKKNVKYRMSLSDGSYSIIAMINHALVKQMKWEIEWFDVLRINGFVKNLIKDNLILTLTQKPDWLYTGLNDAIGLGPAIKNINSVDIEVIRYHKEIVDANIPSYRKVKEIIPRYSKAKQKKACDYYKEGKEEKISPLKDAFESSHTTGNETSYDSEFMSVTKLQYSAKNWKIKVRVTKRSKMIKFNTSKGAGNIINIELIDEFGSQILACFFNSSAEKFDSIIKERGTYIMSGGKIELSKNLHSSIESKYCINFPSEAVIRPIEDDKSVPLFGYNFVPFDKINGVRDGKLIDIIGVVHSMNTQMEFQNNEGKSRTKRQVSLIDESAILLNVWFWGKFPFFDELEENLHQVMLVKQAKVRTYGGAKSLNWYEDGIVELEPEIKRTLNLTKWFEENMKAQLEKKEKQMKAKQEDFKNGVKVKDPTYFIKEILEAIKAEQEFNDGKIKCAQNSELFEQNENGANNQPLMSYVTIHGYIESLSYEKIEKTIYLSCPNQKCKKKVFERDGKFKCEACNETYSRWKPKYMLTMKIADITGRMIIQFYDEWAEKVISRRAGMIKELIDKNEFNKIRNIFKRWRFEPYTFTLKLKHSSFRQESRFQATAYRVNPIRYEDENEEILKRLRIYFKAREDMNKQREE